ncbi:glycine betaine ABC transporter substrate-binding protein [Bacillus sp. FJAT-45037]|uniref:glycine betaine ABC transporter substrate-binding protein n=1 Tax=Bacillus sp. FJAT-45037 TaxID=2011007 RepID=UPI000C2311B2|nr:glycine betaine ABC transporter substrate-binding protein [Bacillus sp. FJAT-45037]
MKKWLKMTTAILSASVILAACGDGESTGSDDSKGTLKVGLNNWAENVAVSNMWKVVLEEEGYDVELNELDKTPVWAGLARGDLDVAPEVWLPITDEPLYEEYGDDVELHEIWYEGTGLGLAVPTYMDEINTIEDLATKQDEIDLDQIVGIDAGASLMQLTHDAVDEYELPYSLIESSEPAMIIELESAYNNQENIVVTAWNPHWIFSEYDLKYLEDTDLVYGEADDIYWMSRTGFTEDFPEIVEWWNEWYMNDDQLSELMAVINEVGDPAEGAEQWVDENRDLINEWIGSAE